MRHSCIRSRTFSRLSALPNTLTIALLLVFVFSPFSYVSAETVPHTSPHALLYVTATKSAIASLKAHINSMDIVAPQTYASKPDGSLLGTPNPDILRIAYNAGAQVMPLVVNQYFSQSGMHQFLTSTPAQDRLIDALVAEAKTRNYIGFQYDFEHMAAADKDLYSAFVEKSAPVFHAAGLQLSVAMGPKHSDDPADYGDGSWDNWTGAFDYARIGAAADFVSVMAYDDSKSEGPVAALPWVRDVLNYSLARIPAEKISLGIPFYFWSIRDKTGLRDHVGTYPSIAKLLKSKTYLKKGWSDEFGVSYVSYIKGGKRLTAWYEDKKSFEQKIALVSDNNLHGFSAWALGQEDPKIWDVMLAMRAPRDGLALKQN